jgi:VanZ family protein
LKELIKYYWPAILWALFIFTLCTIKLGGVEGSPIFFPGFDKLVHCGFFFVFVIFYANGLIRRRRLTTFPLKFSFIVLLSAMFYGGAIEILQATVFTWRDGDWNDFFADSVGASMGIFSILVISAAFGHDKK